MFRRFLAVAFLAAAPSFCHAQWQEQGPLQAHAHTGPTDGGANITPTGTTTIPAGSTLAVKGIGWGTVYDVGAFGYNARAPMFGAVGNLLVDDAPAINSALSSAAVAAVGLDISAGNRVYLPRGSYLVNSPIIIPNDVQLWGAGSRSTIIQAGPGISTGAAIIQMGTGATSFGVQIHGIRVEAQNVALSTCIWSNSTNDDSGVFDTVLNNYAGEGIELNTNVARFKIDGIECFGGPASTSVVACVHQTTSNSLTIIENSATAGNAGTQQLHGFWFERGVADIRAVHCEQSNDCIDFDTSASGSALDISGHVDVSTVIFIPSGGSSQKIFAANIIGNSSPVQILDLGGGVKITSSQLSIVGQYSNGAVIISTGSGVGMMMGSAGLAGGYLGYGVSGFGLQIGTYSVTTQSAAGDIYMSGTLHTGSLTIVANTCNTATTCTATCAAGTYVLGGGCQSTDGSHLVYQSYPDTGTSYTCTVLASDNLRATAICAKIN